jgi:hypothetical protein
MDIGDLLNHVKYCINVLSFFWAMIMNTTDPQGEKSPTQMLSPILCDLKAKTMIFKQNGRVMELRAHIPLQLQLQTTNIESQSDMELNRLLAEFDSVFQEPQGLPLVRFHDHRIPLEPGTHAVVVRPY